MANDKRNALRDWFYRALHQIKRPLRPTPPAAVPGMGAMVQDEGVAFRVWAPHARRVAVSGTFNDWSREKHPLAAEGDGFWSAQVPAAAPGDRYKYVLHLTPKTVLKRDPYARAIAGATGDSVIRATAVSDQPAPPLWMPTWNTLVIYELHIGTFHAPRPGRVGQFDDAIEKLPYLRDLGINAIEIMPVAEFAGDYSWGYNPSDPFAVTTSYGGREAFQRLVQAAHDHGIAVIVDVVYNHFGPQNLDLWQFDGWQQDDRGGIYFYNDERAGTPWGDTRPDYGRGEVRRYIRDNALMWLDELNVDGLRWDATSYIRNAGGGNGPEGDIPEGWSLLQWVNDEIDARRPWAISIAEDLRDNAWLTHATASGGAGFDAQWDARFVHPIRAALTAVADEQRSMTAVADALRFQYEGDAFNRVIYTESHDEVANGQARVPEEIAPGAAEALPARQRATLGAALVFTAPGIPMIFQGQEFLTGGWFEDTVPLDWSRAEQFAGLVGLYRDLIHLRRNHDGLTRGLTGQHIEILHSDEEQKLLVYRRWENGDAPADSVVIVANFSHVAYDQVALPFPAAGRWTLRFNSASTAYDPAFSNVGHTAVTVENGRADITIAPYSALIYTCP